MATVPLVPANASLEAFADILEEDFGVPRELLDRFANKIAATVIAVAETEITDHDNHWLYW